MTELSELFGECADDVQAGIRDLGWAEPMPVQSKTIPLMREGHDLIVQARTGSGKTGAFGIPIIEAVDTELAETQALVMLPTRELANQVAVEVTALGKHRGVRVLPVYGGVGYQEQNDGLDEGAHVIVGTPGRVLDHLGSGRMRLGHVKILVLDEADEMLSLGFWPDMREVRSYLPDERASYLFSATMPEKVRSLARFFLEDEQFVSLSEGQIAPQQIEYYFQLSMLMRQMVEGTHHVPATDRTVGELQPILRSQKIWDEAITDQVIGFLKKADLVKFADQEVSLDQATQDTNQIATLCKGLYQSWQQTKEGAPK